MASSQAQLGRRNPNVSLLVAIGVNDEDYREILGICEGTRRAGVAPSIIPARCLISEACMGLSESAEEFFPDAAWQRCGRTLVPQYRQPRSLDQGARDRAMLKAIQRSGEDIVAARQKVVQVIEELRLMIEELRLTKRSNSWRQRSRRR